jgi:hypothetical protein
VRPTFGVLSTTFQILAPASPNFLVQLSPLPGATGWFHAGRVTPYTVSYGSLTVAPVPVPPAVWLLGTAAVTLIGCRRPRS